MRLCAVRFPNVVLFFWSLDIDIAYVAVYHAQKRIAMMVRLGLSQGKR